MRKNEKEDKNMKFEEMEIKLELFNPKVSQAISSKFETEKVKQSQNLLFKKGSIETLPNLLFFLCVVFTILIRCWRSLRICAPSHKQIYSIVKET